MLSIPAQGVKTGHISCFLQTTAPSGYVIANGGLLSRAAYPALWAHAQASGNIAGTDAAWSAGMYSPGDGATTFRIPELRGEFLRFADGGRGVDAGRSVGSYQADQNKTHSHGVTDAGHVHGTNDAGHSHGVNDPGHTHTYKTYGLGNNGLQGNANTNSDWGYGTSSSSGTGVSINASATGVSIRSSATGVSINLDGGSEARPRNVALLPCIKT